MNPDEGSALELILYYSGRAVETLAENLPAALDHIESMAFWLERRGLHLALAEEAILYVVSREPSRRRQQLLMRILLRMGREREALTIEQHLLPRTADEETIYQLRREEFLRWLGAEGRDLLWNPKDAGEE